MQLHLLACRRRERFGVLEQMITGLAQLAFQCFQAIADGIDVFGCLFLRSVDAGMPSILHPLAPIEQLKIRRLG